MLLCVDNAQNCLHLIKTGGTEALGTMLLRKQTRSAALRLFGQMLVHGQVMLLSLLCFVGMVRQVITLPGWRN